MFEVLWKIYGNVSSLYGSMLPKIRVIPKKKKKKKASNKSCSELNFVQKILGARDVKCFDYNR